VLASVYTLRLYVRAMHNRVGPRVTPREISFSDGLVLAPLVALIVALALYPQLALHKSESSVKASIRDAKALTQPPREASR
jgi:NADH-quinone oxidoreductase subunit M